MPKATDARHAAHSEQQRLGKSLPSVPSAHDNNSQMPAWTPRALVEASISSQCRYTSLAWPHLEASRVERGKGTCPELRALSRPETDDRLGHCLVPEEPATAQWATEMALTARSLPNKRHSRVLPPWDPWQTVSPSHEKPWAHSTTNPVCP